MLLVGYLNLLHVLPKGSRPGRGSTWNNSREIELTVVVVVKCRLHDGNHLRRLGKVSLTSGHSHVSD